ncbi:hypothetical protein [Novosphingobium sp.]|uniref:hypothetical protein n=1 Tax=Novosphingobium sp. TaxID=1874826 RepID=UPI0025D71641|nr:hypothetical protein [Novosphingobium sp.]
MTKPRIFDEAFHFRARAGTKARLDALRGEVRQGDFIRLLIEEALDRREADNAPDQRGEVPKASKK